MRPNRRGASAAAIPVFDALPVLREEHSQAYFEDTDSHKSPAGHDAVTRAAAAWLAKTNGG